MWQQDLGKDIVDIFDKLLDDDVVQLHLRDDRLRPPLLRHAQDLKGEEVLKCMNGLAQYLSIGGVYLNQWFSTFFRVSHTFWRWKIGDTYRICIPLWTNVLWHHGWEPLILIDLGRNSQNFLKQISKIFVTLDFQIFLKLKLFFLFFLSRYH